MKAQRTIYFETQIESHPDDGIAEFERAHDQLNSNPGTHVHFAAEESLWDKTVRLNRERSRADYHKRLRAVHKEKPKEKVDNSPNSKPKTR